jgi:hypothetical protein
LTRYNPTQAGEQKALSVTTATLRAPSEPRLTVKPGSDKHAKYKAKQAYRRKYYTTG